MDLATTPRVTSIFAQSKTPVHLLKKRATFSDAATTACGVTIHAPRILTSTEVVTCEKCSERSA